MIDTGTCKKGIDTQRTDKHVQCEACGKYFLHKKKGRKPKTCSWYKAQKDIEKKDYKQQKEKAKKDRNVVSVPILEKFSSMKEIKEGMLVYTTSNMFPNELSRRMYAREYKVIDKSDRSVIIIRNLKSGHKNYPVEVPLDKIYKHTGNTYINKEVEDFYAE